MAKKQSKKKSETKSKSTAPDSMIKTEDLKSSNNQPKPVYPQNLKNHRGFGYEPE